MLKIFVYINTAFLVIAVGGGAFAFFNRGKITESIMTEVQKQLPSLVKGAMPSIPKTPSATGGVLPF
tara:strand:+ start:2004 stop:2204 length:201 start_codon:yes stop_codon:yes gene_type:complete